MASPSATHGWSKHTSPDGRPFWSKNGQSVWEKPTELKTPAEKEMERTPWKEYETGGRKYWVHSESSETTWNPPTEIQEIIARYSAIPTGPAAAPTPPLAHPNLPRPPSFVAAQSPLNPTSASTPRPAGGQGGGSSASPMTPHSGALVAAGGGGGGPPPAFLPARPVGLPPIPVASALPPANQAVAGGGGAGPGVAVPMVFETAEQATTAFKGMLRNLKVDSTWTWEMVMKEAITDPLYKALRTLAERKAAFEAYLRETEAEEREERDKSLARCRKDWTKALDKVGGGVEYEGGVKSWWSWERAKKVLLEKYPDVYNGPRNDEERKILFEEFVSHLKQKDEVRKREIRGRNMDKLTKILESLELDLAGPVRWQDIRATLFRTPEWHHDPELQRIEPIDMLTVVEDEVKKAEKELAEHRQRVAEDKRRRARKAREEFVALLGELVAADQITSGTTWKSIYPLIDADPRYLNLLGVPGSSPLDLFWDVVDELDVRAEQDEQVVELVAKEKGIKVREESTEEEFVEALANDDRLEKMDYKAIKATFEKLRFRAIRMAKDERRRAEKKLRLLIDDLRYAYKKLDPPVDLDASYEDVLPRIQDTPEFVALDDNEEARRSAFDKFIKRQKEKRAERDAIEAERAERDRVRAERRAKERELDVEYELERERDRERRHGAAGAGRRRGSSAAPSGDGRGEREDDLPYEGRGDERDRKRRTASRGVDEGDEADQERDRKVPRLNSDEPSKARSIPTSSTDIPGSSDPSRASASPDLSSSPLQSMSNMSNALPGSNGYSRGESYDSVTSGERDLPVDDDEEAFDSHGEENEALRKYKEQMHSYLASRFASFKSDLERKTRAEGSQMPPQGLPTKRRT
ncbi:hypothetical protein JCM10212_002457 [Sporobolomyces blumeae]